MRKAKDSLTIFLIAIVVLKLVDFTDPSATDIILVGLFVVYLVLDIISIIKGGGNDAER